MNNTYTELTGFVNKDGDFEFEKLLNLTNLEFATEIKDEFQESYYNFFKVVEKTGFNSLKDPIDQIFVSIGNSIYSRHYLFNKNSDHYNQWLVIVNQEIFENIVRPFQNFIARQSTLDSVIGVDEASELWNLSSGYIKNLCADGKVKAKKIGKTWIIDKHQPHPSK